MKRSRVYYVQNKAIHAARAELESKGIIEPCRGLEMCRFLAGKINLGVESISRLSLQQRAGLIEQLIEMGASVRNPRIYNSDLKTENPKVATFNRVSDEQLQRLDKLADQIKWKESDSYLRFCHRVIKAPRPRNQREITTLRLALESMIAQAKQREFAHG